MVGSWKRGATWGLGALAAVLVLQITASFSFPCATSAQPAFPSATAFSHGTDPFRSSWTPGRLEFTMLDVGQGDGLGIRCPDGRIILVDAGVNAEPTMQYMTAVDTTSIHSLILTHPHLDHMGGAKAIINRYDVKRVYDCGYVHTTRAYADLLHAIDAHQAIDYFQPRAGQILDWGEGLRVEVLHPDTPAYEDINDNSIVLRITFDRVSFVLTGDAERVAEEAILRRYGRNLSATVLKVGHHGSTSSTSEGFLAAVAPKMALISCGTGNSYGHPRAATLERLQKFGARTLRTDTEGWISIITDGASCTTTTARGSHIRVP